MCIYTKYEKNKPKWYEICSKLSLKMCLKSFFQRIFYVIK